MPDGTEIVPFGVPQVPDPKVNVRTAWEFYDELPDLRCKQQPTTR